MPNPKVKRVRTARPLKADQENQSTSRDKVYNLTSSTLVMKNTTNGVAQTNSGYIGVQGIVQGSADNTRLGNSIKVNYIDMIFHLSGIAVGTVADKKTCEDTWRCIMFWDREVRGSTAANTASDKVMSDFLAVHDNVRSQINQDRCGPKGRFKVLYDKTVPKQCSILDIGNIVSAFTPWYEKVRLPVNEISDFTANTGGIADVDKGGLYCIIVNNNAVISTGNYNQAPTGVFTYTLKVNFTDRIN